jgi:hypothetical protein
MSSWIETPIAFEPKRKPATSSWWTDPKVQTDRAEFQKHLVAAAIDHVNSGRTSFTYDKFPKPQK